MTKDVPGSLPPSSRRRFVRSIAGASLLSLAKSDAAARPTIPFVVTGKPLYSIFLSTEASLSERWAAEELRQHIEQMTGSRMTIEVAGIPASRRVIAIGRSELTETLGVSSPDGESCLLKTVGETVVIAGGRQRGSMYGVSLFLEKLGCRWFTQDVARVPKAEALWLPEFNEVHAPGFEYREVFFTEAQGKDWSARNRLNGHFHHLDESVGGKIVYLPWAHSFYDLIPPERYFDAHPEYFAQVSGRRQRAGAQLCLTNADVLRLTIGQVEQWLTEHPEVSVVSVSQNDTAGWCECDLCRQVIKEEGGAVSGLALRFVNQVAARIAISHPGKTIDTLAYQDTADPPSMAQPRGNVQIRLCPIDACQAHSYRTCIYNRRFRQQLEGWARIAPTLHLWKYSINFSHYLAPFPNYDELISDIPLLHRAGISGMFIQGAVSEGGGGDDAELRSYLAARALWKPDLDPIAEIHDFLNAVYGPSATELWSYFLLRQQEVRRGQHLWIDQNLDARYITPEFLKNGRTLLDRALQMAVTEASRRRVQRHLLSLDYVEAMREKRCVFQEQSYGPADPKRAKDETQKLLNASEALSITNFRENYPVREQARDWGDVGALYRAVVLKNIETKAIVIPELGRVITFESSDGKRANILRVPDPSEWAYPHKGGIYVSLSDGESSGFQLLEWQLASATNDGVLLNGRSEAGRDLQMRVLLEKASLRLQATVSNSSAVPARIAILCRAELACGSFREATFGYFDRSGTQRVRKIDMAGGTPDGSAHFAGTELPQQDWALAREHPTLRIRNRFQAGEVARCDLSWSFRGAAGLNVNMSVVSPEIDLAPGQQFSLTSDYDTQ